MLVLLSPKSQRYEVAFVDVLLKSEVNDMAVNVNPATGNPETTVIILVSESEQPDQLETVYVIL